MDVVFLVMISGFWVAMIVNSGFGFSKGNPLSLLDLSVHCPCIKCFSEELGGDGGVKVIDNTAIDKSIHKSINSWSSVLKRYVADVGKAWPVLLLCGGFLPLFLSILWLLMIRYFVSGMLWITVTLFSVLIVSLTMFTYLKAGWMGNDDISPIIVRRILMATSVLKVAAKVIGDIRTLIIFPIISYAILVIFYMFWLSAALHIFSSGSVVQNDCEANCCAYDLKAKRLSCSSCCGYKVHYTSHISAAILFHLFGGFWATQFVLAFSSAVMASSVASYYWARGETSIAITGKGFFKASEIATELIMSNILRIGKVNVLRDVILFLGKLCDTLPSALFAFLILDSHKYKSAHNKISSPLFPVPVCSGFACIVAKIFFGVMEMSIDTIILSFCQDSDEHQGTAQYAPQLLVQTIKDEENEMQRLTQCSF